MGPGRGCSGGHDSVIVDVGGGPQGNSYVDDVLRPAAADLGITLCRVPVADTRDALNRVLSERQAGKTDGSVDLVWVNGDNFATGATAGAWLCGWTRSLPNMKYTHPADPPLTADFGTPVQGCEAPWHKAQFSLVYNADKVTNPPTSLAGVLDGAQAHPGRLTYPAPPDFTGSGDCPGLVKVSTKVGADPVTLQSRVGFDPRSFNRTKVSPSTISPVSTKP